MKKTFVIQVEYPDNDVIPSEEIIEVTKESFEYILSRYFGANIMDGDYDRIKVKEVTDFLSLVKQMREAQKEKQSFKSEMYKTYRGNDWFMSEEELIKEQELYNKVFDLESEIDEYLKKIE